MKRKLVNLLLFINLALAAYFIYHEFNFGWEKSVELFGYLTGLPIILAWLTTYKKGHYFPVVFAIAFYLVTIIDFIFYFKISNLTQLDLLYFALIPKAYEISAIIASFIIGGIAYAYNAPYEDEFQSARYNILK